MDSGGGRTETGRATAEEEALKRNTDCVYYLASPLTCKKGNECEYRHSEAARLNPRDCYYWLEGNCLNPKCSFRHPPLDGLFGAPGSSGPALPLVPPVATKKNSMSRAPAYNLNKPSRNEPCIFFQKGHCLKGERCPFTHDATASGIAIPQQVTKPSPSPLEQRQMVKKEYWDIKQCTNQQSIPEVSVDVALPAPVSSAKPFIRAEDSSYNGLSHTKNLLPNPSGNKLPKSQSAHVPVINSNAWSRDQDHQIHPSDEHLQNGLEPGEIVGEHSSGFDVHVVNNMKDSGYSHNRDDFGRKSAQGGSKVEPFKDYGYRPFDYKPASIYERNQFSGSVHEYERNGRVHGYYDMRPQKISSERSSERSLLPERRVVQRHKSPDEVDRADLRYRLKQRKLDGSRSTISPDRDRREPYCRDDGYVEDKYRGHRSRRDHPQVPLESSVSTRLRGRISLPGISSADSLRMQSEKERDLSKHRGRLSPTRSVINHGRQLDSTRRSPPLTAGARNLGGRLIKRDDVDSLNFSGPKSLAELKGVKHVESSQEQSTKSNRDAISHVQNNNLGRKVASYQEPEDTPFESPKPLSVLKRKREEAAVNGANSSSVDKNNQRNDSAEVCYSDPATSEEAQPTSVAESKDEDSHTVGDLGAGKVESVEEESSTPPGDDGFTNDGQLSAKEDTSRAEIYMELDAEDQELQNYVQRDAESDYEAAETGAFKTEYESQGEEEDELDDEEDFARKAGLLFS